MFGMTALIGVAVVLVASIAMTAAALAAPAAHVVFVRSEPPPNARLASSPARVAAFFEKELDATSSMRLLRSDGSAVDTGPAKLEEHGTILALTTPALAPGTYVAHWHGVDHHDGHALDGYFAFTIGDDPPIAHLGLRASATAEGLRADLVVEPGRLGENAYRLSVTDASGAALRLERPRLRFAPAEPKVGEAEQALTAEAAAVVGRGMELAFRGRYAISAFVRRPGETRDTPLLFEVTAPAATATPSPTPTPPPTPTPRPSPIAAASPPPTAVPTPGPADGPGTLPLLLLAGGALAAAAAGVWLLARRRA